LGAAAAAAAGSSSARGNSMQHVLVCGLKTAGQQLLLHSQPVGRARQQHARSHPSPLLVCAHRTAATPLSA
jgi:hypothetical protein